MFCRLSVLSFPMRSRHLAVLLPTLFPLAFCYNISFLLSSLTAFPLYIQANFQCQLEVLGELAICGTLVVDAANQIAESCLTSDCFLLSRFFFTFQCTFFSFPCHLRFSWPAIDGNFGGKLKDLCLLSLLLSLYLTLSLSLPFPLCVFSLCMRFKMQLTAVFIQWTAAFHAQFVAILIMNSSV